MTVTQLDLEHFRCHTHTTFAFEPGAVLITGPNGVGKTSILEAINIASVSKSFLPVSDNELVEFNASGYRITTHVRHDLGAALTISIEYDQAGGKRISTSAGGPTTAQELIGLVPCVVLTSLHRELFIGEPAIRRSFVDRVLAQCFSSYKHALWRHRTALRQRNRLLALGHGHDSELEVWTDELIDASCEIVQRRWQFVVRFNRILNDTAQELDFNLETITLQYELPWLYINDGVRSDSLDLEALRTTMRAIAQELQAVERERMTTQWGPQRDVLTFCAGQRPLYTVASQGQQKLALYAIKLTEAAYIHHALDRAPILLLDDVFADLDSTNIGLLESFILERSRQWQTFVSAPSAASLRRRLDFQHIPLGKSAESLRA
ncbi:MAG: DNA replication and repair protein RecF [Candidatus Kapaibacterium sp.]|nr:MAG: DNA replication and repair protein RecF [Candidatus Kapabacteria bacterium]